MAYRPSAWTLAAQARLSIGKQQLHLDLARSRFLRLLYPADFIWIQSVILPANQSIQYFSADSMDPGSAANAPGQTFVRHNFTGYTDYRFGPLLVTNNTGITGGRDQEDDTSYQYRIHLKLISTSSCNEDALRSQLLPIPGIQDVSFDSKAGTFYCYVYAITPVASVSLLQTVQQVLAQNVAFPLTGTALNPDLIGISLATTISLKSGATTTDQQTAISNATTAVQNYINNLTIGQTLVINDIANQILNSSSLIVDVGQPGNILSDRFLVL